MNPWMPGVLRSPTPAMGPSARAGITVQAGAMRPDSAVIHVIQGWQSTMMSPSWVRNAYHFTARLDGRKVQHVPIDTPAWHAGDVQSPTWPMYRGINPNNHTVAIAAEGAVAGVSNPFNLPLAWTPAQVDSAIEILRWVGQEAGIRWDVRTLGEHSQINTASRFDPGPRWPKTDVLKALEVDMGGNAWIVQPGDTLWAISRATGVHVADLQAWNGISDASLILQGQVLRLNPNMRPAAAATRDDIADLLRIATMSTSIEAHAKRVRERLEAV